MGSTTTPGRRLIDPSLTKRTVQPGDYWQAAPGRGRGRRRWFAIMPNGQRVELSTHEITEHEDGSTITVSPAIRGKGWSGFLERGVWREAGHG